MIAEIYRIFNIGVLRPEAEDALSLVRGTLRYVAIEIGSLRRSTSRSLLLIEELKDSGVRYYWLHFKRLGCDAKHHARIS